MVAGIVERSEQRMRTHEEEYVVWERRRRRVGLCRYRYVRACQVEEAAWRGRCCFCHSWVEGVYTPFDWLLVNITVTIYRYRFFQAGLLRLRS